MATKPNSHELSQVVYALEQHKTRHEHYALSLEQATTQLSGFFHHHTATLDRIKHDCYQANQQTTTLLDLAITTESATSNALTQLQDALQACTQIKSDTNAIQAFGRQIGTMIASINEIASKMNLLAINTAIIVEKSTQQGEGFKTIAKEIQVLAEQAKLSADEIAKMTTPFTNTNQTTAQDIERALQPLTAIANQQIKPLATSINQMARMAQQLETTTQKITNNIEQAHTNALDHATQQQLCTEASQRFLQSSESLLTQLDQLVTPSN